MTYWPSYSDISPQARAAYLEWLAAGRRDPSACIGYVFLFLYGLERRALSDATRLSDARTELPVIRKEVEELLHVYAGSDSFRRYGSQLVDVARVLGASADNIDPTFERAGYELPVSVRVAVGKIVAAGKPIPPQWALSWALTDPETRLRTPAERCPEEFRALFAARYAKQFRDGLIAKANSSHMALVLRPASASFGGEVKLTLDLPDIATLKAPAAKLRDLVEQCTTDLEAFSRWKGRNDGPRGLAAVALLPPELTSNHGSSEADGLFSLVERLLGPQDRVVSPTDDLLRNCPSFGEGKLAKSEAVILAQLLERRGYGIEPDVRFGAASIAPGEQAVLFKLPPNPATVASPTYAAATILMRLAVAVSLADGAFSSAEEEHLRGHVQKVLGLTDSERIRLAAYVAWLSQEAPSLAGLRKRLDSLDEAQRRAIADFVISVAGADGVISPDEIRTLSKIYPMLGLAADEVYGHVHAMAAGGTAADEAIVTIAPATRSGGYALPAPDRGAKPSGIHLDMAIVNAKLAQTAQVSSILSEIFTESDDPPTTKAPPPSTAGKLPIAYASLLQRMAERATWPRDEYESLAANLKLMPDGAIDAINECAFEIAGSPVLEGDDPIEVDVAIAKELCS